MEAVGRKMIWNKQDRIFHNEIFHVICVNYMSDRNPVVLWINSILIKFDPCFLSQELKRHFALSRINNEFKVGRGFWHPSFWFIFDPPSEIPFFLIFFSSI